MMSSAVRITASRVIRTLRPAAPASTAIQARNLSSDAAETYKSPFAGATAHRTTKIPDFSNYKSSTSTRGNQVFSYFMVGTMGALTAAGAKATVQGRSIRLSLGGSGSGGGGGGGGGYILGLYPTLQPRILQERGLDVVRLHIGGRKDGWVDG